MLFWYYNGMSNLKTDIINIVLDDTTATDADAFKINIYRQGSHGSMSQTGIDKITLGNKVINQLHNITSPLTTPKELNIITVSEFQAENAVNILPNTMPLGRIISTSC